METSKSFNVKSFKCDTSGATFTYTEDNRYTIIGPILFWEVRLVWTVAPGTGGPVVVELPFQNYRSSITQTSIVNGSYFSFTSGATTGIAFQASIGTASDSADYKVRFYKITEAGSSSYINCGEVDATGKLEMNGFFFIK